MLDIDSTSHCTGEEGAVIGLVEAERLSTPSSYIPPAAESDNEKPLPLLVKIITYSLMLVLTIFYVFFITFCLLSVFRDSPPPESPFCAIATALITNLPACTSHHHSPA